ncbi:hypothetical protein E2C01_087510 [Portunus trituberculatus]|uniref:Uncharacterized protein n=1 Tax=Portunus trituberculatus TaxID=210409 RepID=A0A5B7J3J1_PORTR|nr:hypothetical protein [Portunus trituberculatus]
MTPLRHHLVRELPLKSQPPSTLQPPDEVDTHPQNPPLARLLNWVEGQGDKDGNVKGSMDGV